jgi:tetratricopeptide (TPR) repeat protein
MVQVKPTKATPTSLYKKGKEYYKAQDYTNAFLCFEQAAQKGHADAQYFLALCYRDGTGVEKNKKLMWKWYYEASDNGNMIALVVTICVIVALPPMGWLMALFLLLIVVNFVKSVFFASEDDDDV